LVTLAFPAVASAQDVVTISGHVSSNSFPLQNASVRIGEFDVGGTTDADGRYSFIVPSSRVRGQKVSMVARHARYVSKSVDIVLAGGALVQDFELQPIGTAGSRESASIASAEPTRLPTSAPSIASLWARHVVDSSDFEEAAGPYGLPAALAGRLAGVVVTSSSTFGGSSSIVMRGSRSVIGTNQPLIVVDGTPIDNSVLTTSAQQFGFGGFDYATAIEDLNLGDIATVEAITGPAATALYGGRAANGVLMIATRTGQALNAFHVSASQQVTFESALRLPSYQNTYGQGLGGKFSFFDGRGGGVNDGAAENWGPALQGQPIAQASLVVPGLGDVRPWVPQSDNVSSYFQGGRTLTSNVAVQGSGDQASFRFSFNNRDFTGITPNSSLARRGAALTTSAHPASNFNATATVQYFNDTGADRPGTGFDEINPVAEFARMGRQVDIQTLRNRLRDATDVQISWNYLGHNNSYFQSNLNGNNDDRSRWLAGVGAEYAFNSQISATAHVGSDSYDESRDFTVASGWMGGYPVASGRGNFTDGGRQNQSIGVHQRDVDFAVRFAPTGRWSTLGLSIGGDWRSNSLSTAVTTTDKTLNGNVVEQTTKSDQFSADASMHSVFVSAVLGLHDYWGLALVARNEWSSVFDSGDSHLYPSAIGSIDLKRALPALRNGHGPLTSAALRAGWSQSGSDLTKYAFSRIYTGNQPKDSVSLDPSLPIGANAKLKPETTSGFEVGANGQFFGSRLGLDVAIYNERTSDLILAVASQSRAIPTNAGAVSNSGIELTVNATPVSFRNGPQWNVAATYGKNTSSVSSLVGGRAPLGPTRWGVSVEARNGQPLGVIVGTGFLRDKSGQLILREGHPLPDSVAGPRVLGSAQPSWSGGLTNSLKYGWVELSALFSATMGGSVFSASNMWGATSGSLAETEFRPDTGLLIAGIDAATSAANARHTTTEAYYHSLRSITERWVYDASAIKLREARLSVTVPLHPILGFRTQSIRGSIIGRNLMMWTKVPNIDPETALSASSFQGLELGQLPSTRSVGFQITVTP
jgi:outer membrane receptor protein involved in Fe transport